MSQRFKIIFSLIITLVIIGILTYNYIFQNHRDIENEPTSFVISTKDINESFLKNRIEAEIQYLNSTIEISGEISDSNTNSITLENLVFCQFSDKINQELVLNSEVRIKGRVIGYDDLLELVKLDQCILKK